jgi:polysaccharide export outer membrane protein
VKRIARVGSLAIALALSPFGAAQDALPVPSAAAVRTTGDTFLIGPEDVVEVSVWKEDGLRKELLVRPDGGISFPLVGELQAAGKTAAQLQAEIVAKLAKFIPDPVVNVAVLKIASNKIYVLGRVNKPGEYLTGRNIDVLQALSIAGGLTPFAAENRIKIMRKEAGRDMVFAFEYGKVKSGTALEQNVQLKPGDVILVP